ncbi:1-deoxy-d-xylulose 5-phosphate reductoisomerase : 1-deoxy-D-xylulose 5-phosphate reductoisomerase OS=Planctomyces maris DSM 8797 GN=dxr PE=3 SV=1: DXP_reductoisom: DXP_redisom_C: DXPR_C [Gemmataceae bacterium]|nr:1-deoxy-d-xylulose 5-phosphate reductoisomerase : 1-deoxy-D-xylulose 5-phosphate reductoisomerase OS=Planctomyces maris DSM 8797 GN=dxr PE=3 SV=1: DXP_reductoisom: DXP_redisom_C: DXPR_C [Gemmataceae bacterium]VTU01099.1 1-deoxy-d-xylulose 5-phosphate reductoisomerase : 1-deoxy-D-xylulose 5-phosphate reductoisomerase OS=Planctomyces maris DSM 8797 GN=dxr PE=3 SV=1: DXP_reductoisom: DXP_redisom_C: DXPR_C [Gemmataceae bacterium]
MVHTHPRPARPRRVAVLGSTGSVGTSALDVIRHLPDHLELVGVAAHSKWEQLAEQCHAFKPRVAVLIDESAFERADRSAFPPETQLLGGPDAVQRLVSEPDVDVVLSAVVGAAGLSGTWAALDAGKTVALANKETLVVGGSLVTELAAKRGAKLLPVDSEHSAVFQALTGHAAADVDRVVLTASGGPFRGKKTADLAAVTPQQALKHPTWQMGPKITVDSATLMNKALEVIEARWLFDLPAEKIAVIVHPESVVHSFVEFADGSVLAQLSPPDMRLPIQLAFLHPLRVPGPTKRLDWRTLSALTFEQPDPETFPALTLGFEVAARGGTCGAVLNAANEAAVAGFLTNTIAFTDIARCCRAVLDAHDFDPRPTLERLLALDRWARQEVASWTRTRTPVAPCP